MFARPRPKKILAPPVKKRKRQHAIEEIKFDDTARAEYLSGFHKRKLQRAKNAQEQAAKQAREDKILARKQVWPVQSSPVDGANPLFTLSLRLLVILIKIQIREDRKREVEEHVQNVHNALKLASQAGYIDSDEAAASDDDTVEEWGGFKDDPVQEDLVDHEEEYIDEDRYTTVTVESVSVSRDGLLSSRPDEEESADEEKEAEEKKAQAQPEKKHDKDRHMNKKKKPKFRYETKLERQITNIKQKAKNRRKPKE